MTKRSQRSISVAVLIIGLAISSGIASGQQLVAGVVSADPGDVVWIDMTLLTEGKSILSAEGDITWNPNFLLFLGCEINEELDKQLGAAFGGGAPCSGCARLRLTVMPPLPPPYGPEPYKPNQNAIDDGTVLYRCGFLVSSSATADYFIIGSENATASDPGGNTVPATTVNGAIVLADGC